MRGAAVERLVNFSGQQLGDIARIRNPGEIGIGEQVSVGGERPSSAVFGKRCPSRKQWPDDPW
jgi:hypothetical protein